MFDMSDRGKIWSGFSRYHSPVIFIQSYLDLSPHHDQEEGEYASSPADRVQLTQSISQAST